MSVIWPGFRRVDDPDVSVWGSLKRTWLFRVCLPAVEYCTPWREILSKSLAFGEILLRELPIWYLVVLCFWFKNCANKRSMSSERFKSRRPFSSNAISGCCMRRVVLAKCAKRIPRTSSARKASYVFTSSPTRSYTSLLSASNASNFASLAELCRNVNSRLPDQKVSDICTISHIGHEPSFMLWFWVCMEWIYRS